MPTDFASAQLALDLVGVFVAVEQGVLRMWMLWAAAGLVFVVRLIAMRLDLNAPPPLRSCTST